MRLPAAAGAAATALVLAAAPLPAATIDSTLKTIVLVRHADKDTVLMGADVPLNARGMLRARELARTLGAIPFRRVFVTPWQRNRQTAAPLAERTGDSLTVIDGVAETVAALRAEPWGSASLVVGHSNTLPAIATALTGLPFADSSDVRYDALYVVTLARAGGASLVKLRFGEPAQPAR